MMGSEDETPVKAPREPEPDAAPEAAELSVRPPKNGRAKRVSAYIGAAVTAAVAAYGAAKPEVEGRRALVQIEAGYQELSQQVTRLQHWAHANRAQARAAEASCKAEVAALQSFAGGFLLGQSGASGARRAGVSPSGGGSEAVEALVKALEAREQAAKAKTTALGKLPRLKPSKSSVQQLLRTE